MTTTPPQIPGQTTPPAPTPPAPRKRNWLLLGCGGLLAVLLLMVLTVLVTIWWIQRPIKPVVLSPKEQATLDTKLKQVEDAKTQGSQTDRSRPSSDRPVPESPIRDIQNPPAENGHYVPGSKQVRLTDREVNGLLNQNTDLGKSVRLEFARDAINAYVAVLIPQDFPIMGGKMFRARARFRVSIGNGGEPYAILDDVTVFGLSLPKAWLGGLKGENLLRDAVADQKGRPVLQGVKSLRIEPGALVLQVED